MSALIVAATAAAGALMVTHTKGSGGTYASMSEPGAQAGVMTPATAASPTHVTAEILYTEQVKLTNDRAVYMVVERMTPQWATFVEVFAWACEPLGKIVRNLRPACAKVPNDGKELQWTDDLQTLWTDQLKHCAESAGIGKAVCALLRADGGAGATLEGLAGGIVGLQHVTAIDKHSWCNSRYIVYATDTKMSAPFQHVLPVQSDSTVVALQKLLQGYRPILMMMASADVPDTPIYFNRGIVRMPTQVLEGKRKETPSLSMALHSFSARYAQKHMVGKEWLLVSPLEAMAKILFTQMGEHVHTGDRIPVSERPRTKEIADSYMRGAEDINALVKIQPLATWKPKKPQPQQVVAAPEEAPAEAPRMVAAPVEAPAEEPRMEAAPRSDS